MSKVTNALFGQVEKWHEFDAYKYYVEDYKEKKLFGITAWYLQVYTATESKCKVINFKKLEKEDKESKLAMVAIVSHCMSLDILPDFEEILQLEQIPSEWVARHVFETGDFYRRFLIKDYPIHEVVKVFDDRLSPVEKPIRLRVRNTKKRDLGDADENDYSKYGERELYITLRNNLKLKELKNFKIQFSVYLSELIGDRNLDAVEVVRRIMDMEESERYEYIMFDFANFSSDKCPTHDALAELFLVASKRGIIVDFSEVPQSYEIGVYRKIYRRIYNFDSRETFIKSFREIYNEFGEEFYITDRFRKWYPVIVKMEGDDVFLTSDLREIDAHNLLDINDIDGLGSSNHPILKLSDNMFKLNIDEFIPLNSQFGIVNKEYVIGPHIPNQNSTRLIFHK